MKCGKKLEFHYQNGTILRADTLNAQAEETTNFRNSVYSDYPNGIVSGFALRERKDGMHYLSNGLLKVDGDIYLLPAINLDAWLKHLNVQPDCIYYLCLQKAVTPSIAVREETSPITESVLELVAHKKSEMKQEEWVVAKFMQFAGDFKFAVTLKEHCNDNYFSTMCGDYAISGGKAVSSDFTNAIQTELEQKYRKDSLDVALYLNCLQSNCLSRKALIAYCSCKLERPVEWNEVLTVLQQSIGKNIDPVSVILTNSEKIVQKNNDGFDHNL